MDRYICKVEKSGKGFRINVPRQVVIDGCWADVAYVLLEPLPGGKIMIRRFVDGESLKTEDNRG